MKTENENENEKQKAAKLVLVPENTLIKTGIYWVFGRRIISTTKGLREPKKLYWILFLLRVLGDLRFYMAFYLFEEPLCFYLKKKNVNLALKLRKKTFEVFFCQLLKYIG